jgi:cell division protein FtsB
LKLLIGFLVLLLVTLQYRLWLGDGGLREIWELEGTLAGQQREIESLRERNRALEAEVVDLKQGLDAVEERARSELGMVREGETFYQIVDTAGPSQKGALKR